MDLPLDFKLRMKNMLGDEYDDFEKAFCSEKNYIAVRINQMKDKDGICAAKLGLTEGVPWCPNGFYTEKGKVSGNSPYHAAGVLYFQEPSAMAAAEALPVSEGDRILDLCAAPGGKTTQLAAKMNGTGVLVSNDISASRAKILAENVARLGFSNVVVTNETPQRLAEKYPAYFNKVVIDAPCSGEGMFRKEPQAVQCWSISHTESCAARQCAIADSAMQCLRTGGYLLYSTCTFAPFENEGVINYILEKYPYMKLENPKALSMLSPSETMPEAKRLYPHKVKGEGHFVALLHDIRDSEKNYTDKCIKKEHKAFREFESEFLNTHLEGEFLLFGDNVYMKPYGVDIDKIKTVLPGLHLGADKKNRFEPSYNLCHALKMSDFKNAVSLNEDDLKKYLCGECIPCTEKGWTAVCVDSFPIGWGKASGGVLKNHYPKHLRLNGNVR